MASGIGRRFRRVLLGLALGLSLVFAALTLLLLYVTEDLLFENQLREEHAELMKVPAGERSAWTPGNRRVQLYLQRDELPAALRGAVGQKPGLYEHFDGDEAYFVLSGSFPDERQGYFLVYDVGTLLAVRSSRPVFVLVAGFGALLVAAGAMGVALYLARVTLRPLKKLTDRLSGEVDEDLPRGFAAEFAGDEIGVLAEALESALDRVRAGVQREFEFNRGVSHELRSPIQVAKNALELVRLRGTEDHPQLAQPIERLERSVIQMETVTEAFLWLASGRTGDGVVIDAKASAEKLVDEHRHLLLGKPVRVEIEAAEGVEYRMPEPVFAVVAGNLLRNAIQHTDEGEIRCRFTADQVVVEDTGTGFGPGAGDASGFGIGLNIVERICDRFGWKLRLAVRGSGGARASIDIRTG